jgi:hypothetical protein
MVFFGNYGVQRGKAPLPGVWGYSPSFKNPPRLGDLGGSKAFLNALRYIIMIKEEK